MQAINARENAVATSKLSYGHVNFGCNAGPEKGFNATEDDDRLQEHPK